MCSALVTVRRTTEKFVADKKGVFEFQYVTNNRMIFKYVSAHLLSTQVVDDF